MTILKLAPMDNLAMIAIGFLGLTVVITFGLGAWVMLRLSKKPETE